MASAVAHQPMGKVLSIDGCTVFCTGWASDSSLQATLDMPGLPIHRPET